MNEHVAFPEPSGVVPVPGLYDEWPGDPGPKPQDRPPFPINNLERFQFADGIFYFKRRTTAGAFVFEPEDAAAPLIRSSWRLTQEFEARILMRLDRGRAKTAGVTSPERNLSPEKVDRALPSGENLKRFIDRVRAFQSARIQLGLKPLPISGPRKPGVRSEPQLKPRNLDELLANLAQEFGENTATRPHWKTFAKHLASVRHLDLVPAIELADGRTVADHPLRTGGGVLAAAREIIEQGIRNESLSGIQSRIRTLIRDRNKVLPEEERIEPKIGRVALRNILLTYPGIEISEDVNGLKKTRTLYRMTGKLERPGEPFSLIELDWHLYDLENEFPQAHKILSELAGKPISRIWLVAAVCVATGWCVGFSWTAGPVTQSDVMRCFAHICRRKPSYAHLDVVGDWPAGVPKMANLDLGKANTSGNTVAACTELGIEFGRGPKETPEGRPHIERFFGVVEQEFVKNLDGWIGPNVASRPERSASVQDLIATDELERRFIRYNVDYRANKGASTRFLSARAAFLDYEKRNPGWAPDTAPSEEELDRILRVRKRVKARIEGVRFKHMFYQSEAIRKIRSDAHAHSEGDPWVEIRINPDDISDVIVFDPHPRTGGWHRVECCYRGYARGKSIRLHDIIYSALMAAKKAEQKVTEELLDRTYAEIVRRTSEKARRRGARRSVAGAAARLASLYGPGGADPVGAARDRVLTTEEFRQSAYGQGSDAPLVPAAPAEFDEAAARRQLAEQDTVRSRPTRQTHASDQTQPPLQDTDNEEDDDDQY